MNNFCVLTSDSTAGCAIPYPESSDMVSLVAQASLDSLVKQYPWEPRRYADGTLYVGEMRDEKRHGKGIQIDRFQTLYIGEWEEDLRHGYGIFVQQVVHGAVYIGQWARDKMSGLGAYAFHLDVMYEGEMLSGLKHGQGRFMIAGKSYCRGTWKNNVFILPSQAFPEVLGCPLFLEALLGKGAKIGYIPSYPIAILSQYFQDPLLKMAYDLIALPYDEAADKIDEILHSDQPEVFYLYQSRSHIVGLAIKYEEELMEVSIYNAGDGVQYHRQHPTNGRKFETEWVVTFDRRYFDKNQIKDFLNRQKKFHISCLYDYFNSIPDAMRRIYQSPIWQTVQKGENCSVESIFAYLKNYRTEEEYLKLRHQLFFDCLTELSKQPSPDLEAAQVLAKKLAKRANLLIAK